MGHSFLIQQSLAGETVLQNNQSIFGSIFIVQLNNLIKRFIFTN
tara:strand:- start:1972 stop:2103 length:132 start_codon:yes stop_codon:yes gene_type:complete